VWEGGGATSVFAAFKNRGRKPESPALSRAAPPPAANVGPVDAGDFSALMSRFLDAAGREQPTAAVFLEGGRIVANDGNLVTIELPLENAPAAQMLERNNRRENLQQVLSNLLGTPAALKINVSDTPAAAEANPRPAPGVPPTVPRHAAQPEPEPAAPQQQGIPVTEELRIEILQNVPPRQGGRRATGRRIVKVE
jgi:hypothetical protein